MNIEELKRLAEAATPGPWEYDHGCIADNGKAIISEYFVRLDGDDVSIAANIIDPESCRPSKSNAAYIAAANPSAVLELIRQRDELLVAAKDAHQVLRDWVGYIPSSTIQEDLDMLGMAITNAEKQS